MVHYIWVHACCRVVHANIKVQCRFFCFLRYVRPPFPCTLFSCFSFYFPFLYFCCNSVNFRLGGFL